MEGRDIVDRLPLRGWGRGERLAALVGELFDAKADMILARGASCTRAVKKATTTIPVVFDHRRPCRIGLQRKSWPAGQQHHGPVASTSVGLVATKPLELIHEIVSGASRIAVLIEPGQTRRSSPAQGTLRKWRLKASALLSIP